jgi:hypothetical protein
MQFEIDSKTLDFKHDEAYLADVGDARKNQSLVQDSTNASWFAKNVQPLLAIGLILVTS